MATSTEGAGTRDRSRYGAAIISALLLVGASSGLAGGPLKAAFRTRILGRHEEHVEQPFLEVPAAQVVGTQAPPVCDPSWSKEWPSVFCFALVTPDSYEQDSVVSMLQRRAGIFACNDVAIISSELRLLGQDNCNDEVWTWLNEAPRLEEVEDGGDWQVTDVFLDAMAHKIAWTTLIQSGKVWEHDWTVKVDPDLVFFPDRLRPLLKDRTGTATFFANRAASDEGLTSGSLEVLSKQAVGSYKDLAHERCAGMDWSNLGGGLFVQECMARCDVPDAGGLDVVGDGQCSSTETPTGQEPCSDGSMVAFRVCKDQDAYWKCWDESAR